MQLIRTWKQAFPTSYALSPFASDARHDVLWLPAGAQCTRRDLPRLDVSLARKEVRP